MVDEKVLEEAMQFIAGSCMISAEAALITVAGENISEADVTEFEEYLDKNECYECEICGWYTHPGETCDCENENDDDS